MIEVLPCNQLGPEMLGRPACNRRFKHEPPHRRYDPHTFAVLAEWKDEDVESRPRRWKRP